MTRIEQVSREELLRLISSGEWGKVEDKDAKKLEDFLTVTSQFWIGAVGNDIICAFGIAPPTFLSDQAYFWVWATNKLKDHVFIFTRRSQIVVRELLKQFPILFGHCDTDEPGSKRWLTWLGAEFQRAEGDMIPFVIRRA